MGERLAEGWKKAKASVPLDGSEPAPADGAAPPADAAAAPADATAPDAAASPADATQPDADAAATPAEQEFVIDDGESVAPQDFAKELGKDPAAKAFFDKNPDLKNRVFGALRRDEENRELRTIIPDVATAKVVSKTAATFQQIDNRFLASEDPANVPEFLNHWVREAMIVGDDGKPIIDPKTGKYQLHPALGNIFNRISSNKISVYGQQAETTGKLPAEAVPLLDGLKKFAVSNGNERLQTALDVIREEALSPSSPAQGEFPDELKPYADSLKAKEDALNKREGDAVRQQREQRESANNQAIERVVDLAADTVRTQLKQKFVNAGLTEFEQEGALRVIGEQIDEKLEADEFYQSRRLDLESREPSESRDRELRKLFLTHTQTIIGRITADVLRRAKAGTLDRQTTKDTTVATQTATSKTDPQGASITTSGPQTQTPAQLRTQVIDEYKKSHNGEEPDRDYVMKEGARRMGLFGMKK